jgi:magnesium chelatase family protein
VEAARVRQRERCAGEGGGHANAHIGARQLRRACRLDAAGEELLRSAVARLGLSARAYHRVLRIARTIADLAGTERVEVDHLAEAVQYRALDRARIPG